MISKTNNFFRTLFLLIFGISSIAGLYALKQAEYDGAPSYFMAMWAFALMIAISSVWKNLSQKCMVLSIVLMGVLALSARYFPDIYYVATGNGLDWGFYRSWAFLLCVPGAPIMWYILKRNG